jgi:hypothetical protein
VRSPPAAGLLIRRPQAYPQGEKSTLPVQRAPRRAEQRAARRQGSRPPDSHRSRAQRLRTGVGQRDLDRVDTACEFPDEKYVPGTPPRGSTPGRVLDPSLISARSRQEPPTILHMPPARLSPISNVVWGRLAPARTARAGHGELASANRRPARAFRTKPNSALRQLPEDGEDPLQQRSTRHDIPRFQIAPSHRHPQSCQRLRSTPCGRVERARWFPASEASPSAMFSATLLAERTN